METLIILLHILIAVAIIAFVLLQQGKGAEAGASFGAGASQTLFGSAGSWNFFSRVTAVLAVLFFLSSFALAIIAKNNASGNWDLTPELQLLDKASDGDSGVPDPAPGSSPEAGRNPADEIPEAAPAPSGDGAVPELEPAPDGIPEDRP